MTLVCIILFVFISSYIDYEHLKDNDYIESHVSRWLLRLLFIFVLSNDLKDFIGCSMLFIALFDSVLNTLRGMNVFYLGSTAVYDRFWKRIPYTFIVFKIMSFFIGTYLLLL